MNSLALQIAAVIESAATRHEPPVTPLSLLDIKAQKIDGYLRARLNSVIAYHLHHNYKLSYVTIGKAYRCGPNTIRMRHYQGIRLVKKSPWKNTYLKLP